MFIYHRRYAFRPKFDEFVIQYKIIGYQMSEKVKENSPETCKVILDKAGITGYQMGKHKVTTAQCYYPLYHHFGLYLLNTPPPSSSSSRAKTLDPSPLSQYHSISWEISDTCLSPS